jgi:hypothetical protein
LSAGSEAPVVEALPLGRQTEFDLRADQIVIPVVSSDRIKCLFFFLLNMSQRDKG